MNIKNLPEVYLIYLYSIFDGTDYSEADIFAETKERPYAEKITPF